MPFASLRRHPALPWAAVFTLLFALGSLLPATRFISTPVHYLLLHTLLESFAVAVSAMVFALGWNLRQREDNGLTTLLGLTFLAVALLDFMHTLSYTGMPDFITPSSPEKAINFWLVGRLIAALGLLAAGLLTLQRWPERLTWPALAAALGLTGLITWIGLFHAEGLPRTFIEGQGLTPFKIGFEYLLTLLYIAAAVLLLRRAQRQHDANLIWLAAAAWTLGLTELFFTWYQDVTDLFNVLGHLYKAAAYLMIYRALFAAGVRAPYQALAEEKARLRALIDSVPDLIFFKDRHSHYLGYNKAFAAYCGRSEEEMIGKTDFDFAPREVAEAYRQNDRETLATGKTHQNEEWATYPDGRRVLLDTVRTPYVGPDGQVLGLIGVSRDITEREEAARTIRENALYNKLLFTDSQIPLVVVDPETMKFVDCNEAAVAIYRLPNREAVLGLTPLDVSAPTQYDGTDSATAAKQHIDAAVSKGSNVFMWRHQRPNGEIWDAEVHLMQLHYRGQALLQFSLQDITERRHMETELRRLATTDPLTGVANRRHFLDSMEQEIGRVRRFATAAAVLMLDLDHFKQVNDRHGHAAGDAVLQHFSRLCSGHLRRTDLFGRLGGEEFAVLLPGTELAGAQEWAERLREAIAATPANTESGAIAFTVSIGVTAITPGDAGSEAILSRADAALYRAKSNGRNRVEVEPTQP